MKNTYTYGNVSHLNLKDNQRSQEFLTNKIGEYSYQESVEILVSTCKLAQRLGISLYENQKTLGIKQKLAYETIALSKIAQRKILFLRGWDVFESCIKGFNAIGLLEYHISKTLNKLSLLSHDEIIEIKKDYLLSRKNNTNSANLFSSTEVATFTKKHFDSLDLYDIAIWKSFYSRTIFCSTSGNMGISTHQALRLMQATKVSFKNKSFYLLNKNEGKLVIWAPDKRADFMSKEKSFFLEKIQNETPSLTKIRTYINRPERDPGALSDALAAGGYFFPTNPQSKIEIQNLLFLAFKKLKKKHGTSFFDLLTEQNVQDVLTSLDCTIENKKIVINKGLEAGIYGLMTPYFIMIEQLIIEKNITSISTWNQASIGAALAGAVYADHILRSWDNLKNKTKSDIAQYFPNTAKYLSKYTLGTNIKTEVHGVFDIANLQSLAQLLGVVIKDHLSGRNTAFVGLGSSSYSNGNRCYDILKESIKNNESFKGRESFHPVTHTIVTFAQAIIYGEDLLLYLKKLKKKKITQKLISSIKLDVRKTEPAGAASVAGYLLTRLDNHTISIVEIAYLLQLFGFSKDIFLEFSNYNNNKNDQDLFIQKAFEEGPLMGNLAKQILVLIDWPHDKLKKLWVSERKQSSSKILKEGPKQSLNLYITGDNGHQPTASLILKITKKLVRNKQRLTDFSKHYADIVSYI